MPVFVLVATKFKQNNNMRPVLEFSLSSEPVLGQYKISAVSPSLKEEVQFTVSEYVLPKFEVSLVPPAAVVRDAEMTEFKVCC